MGLSFVHPAHIPVEFALAVHRVMHNTATAEDWAMFDQRGHDQTLAWVDEVLRANKTPNVDRELAWWAEQLMGRENGAAC